MSSSVSFILSAITVRKWKTMNFQLCSMKAKKMIAKMVSSDFFYTFLKMIYFGP